MFNVVLFSGELCHEEVDFALPGLIPVDVSRAYRSALRRAGRLGFCWAWPWDIVLKTTDDGCVFEVDAGALSERYPAPPPGAATPSGPLRRRGPLLVLTRDNGYVYYFIAEDAALPRGALVGAIEDAHGNRLMFDNADGRVRALRDSEGRALHFAYDVSGRVVRIQLVGGVPSAPTEVVTYEYSAAGDLIHVVNRCGARTAYEYDDHLLVTLLTPAGGAYHAQYDAARRCIRRWRADGRLATTFDYDDVLRRVLVTDALGNAELVSLGERGEIQQEISADGFVKTYSHDASGGLLSISNGGAGTLVVTETNGTRQKVTMADAAGVTITQTIDVATGVREVRNGCGGIWTSIHDAKDQLMEERLPSGATTRYEYEPNGTLRAFTDPSGNTVRVVYREGGRIALVHDDVGDVARQQWDEEGRLVQYAEPLSNPIRYRYDSLGRVIGVSQPSGGAFEFRLDAGGECVELHDPAGVLSRYEYSPYGEILAEISAGGGAIRWEYDLLARVTAIRNQANEEMRFEYDVRSRIIRQTFFDGRREAYRYDDSDNLVAIEEADGTVSELEFDSAGRLVRVTTAGDSVESVSYDDAGRAVELANGDVILRYAYDTGHRVTAEEQDGIMLERDYDPAGQCTALTVAGVGRRSYEYDLRRRLTRLVDFDGTEILFHYDVQDRLVRASVEGIDADYEYAPFGRLATTRVVVGTEVFRVSYAYDAIGRVVRRLVAGREEVEFEYNADARLVAYNRGAARIHHRYSATGDLLGDVNDHERRYGAGGRLQAAGETSFEHDARGRVTQRHDGAGRTRFVYDGFDRLVRVMSDQAGTIEFVYDAEGRMLRKRTSAGETRYVWADDTLIAEIANDGNVTSFVPMPAALGHIWISRSDLRGILVSDLNAYPIACVRPDGGRLEDDPDPWGRTQLWPVVAPQQPLRLAGQYDVHEIGVHYNRHRFYDPDNGRYLTPDPIGINGGLNAYAYSADPINVVDPLGLTITTLNPGQKPQVRKKQCPSKPDPPDPRPDPTSSACPASRGASIHNDCIKLMEKEAIGAGLETRTDAVMKFGKKKQNRPDLTTFVAQKEETTAVFCEWDYSPANRTRNHIRDICRNHPGSTIYLVKLPQTSRFSTGRPGKPTPKKLGSISRSSGPSHKDCGIDVIKTDMGI